jgi:hypothetical protein
MVSRAGLGKKLSGGEAFVSDKARDEKESLLDPILIPFLLLLPNRFILARLLEMLSSMYYIIFVYIININIKTVGTLQLGYPLLLCQDSRSYP